MKRLLTVLSIFILCSCNQAEHNTDTIVGLYTYDYEPTTLQINEDYSYEWKVESRPEYRTEFNLGSQSYGKIEKVDDNLYIIVEADELHNYFYNYDSNFTLDGKLPEGYQYPLLYQGPQWFFVQNDTMYLFDACQVLEYTTQEEVYLGACLGPDMGYLREEEYPTIDDLNKFKQHLLEKPDTPCLKYKKEN